MAALVLYRGRGLAAERVSQFLIREQGFRGWEELDGAGLGWPGVTAEVRRWTVLAREGLRRSCPPVRFGGRLNLSGSSRPFPAR